MRKKTCRKLSSRAIGKINLYSCHSFPAAVEQMNATSDTMHIYKSPSRFFVRSQFRQLRMKEKEGRKKIRFRSRSWMWKQVRERMSEKKRKRKNRLQNAFFCEIEGGQPGRTWNSLQRRERKKRRRRIFVQNRLSSCWLHGGIDERGGTLFWSIIYLFR